MKISKKSLCVFIHYSEYPYIPTYVGLYVNELSLYFDEIIMVSNIRPFSNKSLNLKNNISTVFVKNEGYDLGKFYTVINSIQIEEYKTIACINDSNILFNDLGPIFRWSESKQFDFWGLIDSYEKPWFSTHKNNYHIQSHFIVLNQNAINKLPGFFNTLKIDSIFKEKNITKLRQAVINDWEIGLTQYMISQEMSYGTYIDSNAYSNEFLSGKIANVGHILYAELIGSGYPLIKKKIISKKSWKGSFLFKNRWEQIIRKYGNQNWNMESLIDELNQIQNDSGNQTFNNLKKKLLNTYSSLFNKKVA